MSIICLDLGTNLGWSVYYGPGDTAHGVMSFKPGRFEGGGMRWVRFRSWLSAMHEQHGPVDAIHFEEVRAHKGTDAAHAYGGFLATLTGWCEGKQIPYAGHSVGEIKRHATGKGNANKAAMSAAVRRLGFSPADDNDADAIALMLYVVRDQWRPMARAA